MATQTKLKGLNLDVFRLYDTIYFAKGENDISRYERKVCQFYEKELANYLESAGINCTVSIDNKKELETSISNVEQMLELNTAIREGFNKGADFRLMKGTLNGDFNLSDESIKQKIEKLILEVKALPQNDMVYGASYTKNPFMVLFVSQKGPSDISQLYYETASKKGDVPDDPFIRAIEKAKDPFSNKAVYNEAFVRAKVIEHRHPDMMFSVNDVIKAYLTQIISYREEEYEQQRSESGKKTRSFWIGLIIWAVLMITAGLILFAGEISIFQATEYNGNGFFANLGITIVYILGGVVMGMLLGLDTFFSKSNPISKFLYDIPMLPRGLCTMLTLYLVYFSDFSGDIGTYKVPYCIFGTVCIVLTGFMELLDVRNGKFATNFRSTTRGRVMYSPIMAVVPVIILWLFAISFAFLHIVAIWILSILASLWFLVLGIVLFFDIG